MGTLTFLGHAAFLLEGDGITVAVDPFLTGNPAAARAAAEITPSTILLTHAHNDHLGDTVEIAQRTGAKVIATVDTADWLTSQGVENAIGANHGGTVAFDGGTAKLVPAWHSSSYTFQGQRVAHGVPAGLVVRFAGRTIYFAGDTCLFGDMKLIGDEGLDIAVVPIGDHFTMGPADAARAAEFLGAPIVIPCHFNTFPAIEQDAEAFAGLVSERTGGRSTVVTLKSGHSHDL